MGHIFYGHINNLNGTTEAEETEADEFAKEILIPQKSFQEFIIHGKFDAETIQKFASQIEIDPGIVVGRLQKEGYIEYNRCNQLKTKYSLTA